MENKLFRTKDLYLASFLYAKHIELARTEKTDRVCWFTFNDFTLCNDLSSTYWAGRGEIPPKAYSDALRSLKDIIFATL